MDDGSTDETPEALRAWQEQPGVTILRHAVNQGKGAAIRTGLRTPAGAVHDHPGRRLGVRPAGLSARDRTAVVRGGPSGLRFALPPSGSRAPQHLEFLPDGSVPLEPLRTVDLRRGSPMKPPAIRRFRRPCCGGWTSVASALSSARRSRPRLAGWATRSSRCRSATTALGAGGEENPLAGRAAGAGDALAVAQLASPDEEVIE